jgi:transposase-like protein
MRGLHGFFTGSARFHRLLVMFDHDLARAARAQGCRCGGKLHSADYTRKPRGVPADAREFYSRRLSLCCAKDTCRKRTIPPSLRFLGRRVYVAVTMLLVSVMVSGGTQAQLSELAREFGIDRRTIARWRDWWRTTFVATRLWQAAQASFSPPADEGRLPASMFERYLGGQLRRLVSLLRFLKPITRGAAAVRVS